MNYHEFSVSKIMQLILAVLSIPLNAFNFHVVNDLTIKIHNEKLKNYKKYYRVLFLNAIVYTAAIYIIYALNLYKSFSKTSYTLITASAPVYSFAVYYICKNIVDIPAVKSIFIVRHSSYFLLLSSVLYLVLRNMFFVNRFDGNYLLETFFIITISILRLIIYLICLKILSKRDGRIKILETYATKNVKSLSMQSFLMVVLIYIFILYIVITLDYSMYSYLVASLCVILYSVVDIEIIFMRNLDALLENKNAYILGLTKSIGNSKSLRENYKSILFSFGKYLDNNDIKSIKLYHESILGKTELSVKESELMKKMPQNPALISLVLNKLSVASKNEISMQISVTCELDNISMNDFDLCRILGNLLDNAIEAAALSQEKSVILIFKENYPDGILIILTNSSDRYVDINNIAQKGLSSKKGHMGVGIVQVYKTIKKYKNAEVSYSFYNYNFTASIEILN